MLLSLYSEAGLWLFAAALIFRVRGSEDLQVFAGEDSSCEVSEAVSWW